MRVHTFIPQLLAQWCHPIFCSSCTISYRTTHSMRSLLYSTALLPWFITAALSIPQEDLKTFRFDQFQLELTHKAILLARRTFFDDPFVDSDQFEYYDYFIDKTDAALIAGDGGRCYVSFRPAMIQNPADMWQQFLPGTESVCPPQASSDDDCCIVRAGYYRAYFTDYLETFKQSLQTCVETVCEDLDDCVLITGMSQGASAAAIAQIDLAHYNPTIYVFGQYPTFQPNCTTANSDRWYRFVNTGYCRLLGYEFMAYDFQTTVNRGEVDYGQMILLSDDVTGVAALGRDAQSWDVQYPLITGLSAHSFQKNETPWAWPCGIKGYRERLDDMLTEYATKSPNAIIRSTGFSSGTTCTKDIECDSGSCIGVSSRRPGKCS